jgi:GH15 family glucan-1,4-alpha-glucosidase
VALPIEDYGLIGDTHTAALVGRDGSIDWLCMPRFDSPALFAALLGTNQHGRWRVAPAGEPKRVERRYRGDTLVLETEFETGEGSVRLIDFMPPRQERPDVVRIVEGMRGRVPIRMELVVRFDYGSVVPWARSVDGDLLLVGGPDALCLRTPVDVRGENLTSVADFAVAAGEQVPFVLTWYPSHEPMPRIVDAGRALADTEAWWLEWAARSRWEGKWRGAVMRSLLTLKALTYAPTGGIVAAPTTSLPEQPGSVRNWDYRYCWIRDATFTLEALMAAGYTREAAAWRDWLLRAVAGDPEDLQILYGPGGERRITEFEVPWLPGYEDSRPVRIGNAACSQRQLDVYGELMDALWSAEQLGLDPLDYAWEVQKTLLDHLESAWKEPDEGIWEVRGPRRHFTHSKVIAWVAADRAARSVEAHADGSVSRWRGLAEEIRDEVLREAWDGDRGAFVQYYGGDTLDASVLMIPLVGFLPPEDERVRLTVDAIERELMADGFVKRYPQDERGSRVDGLPPGEGAFLPCTFWLAANLNLIGRHDDACRLFDRLLDLRNDLGLLAEEYDPAAGRQLGNFPQAFTHVELVAAARNLSQPRDDVRPRVALMAEGS